MHAEMIASLIRLKELIFKDKRYLFLIVIFLTFAFLRFYAAETKSNYSYDQVDNAWAAKNIIVDHNFPLNGPENKLSSGVFVGPLYYYFVSIFYFFTNLDPAASGLIAGFTGVIGFFTLFFITKRMFSLNVALIAIFINTISYSAIELDRVQWEVNFIPIVSLFILYFLYKILLGDEKKILYLGIALALSFHVHLTAAVFLPIVSLLSLPFFPKTKKTLSYSAFSIPILLTGLSPIIIANILNNDFYAIKQLQYADSSFHGLHLTRVLQLFRDTFIQIEPYLYYPIRSLSFAILPLFSILYLREHPSKKRLIIIYLFFLFFAVPLLVLSTYSHEITNYYFSINRFIGLIALAYLICRMLELKNKIIALFIIVLAIYSTALTLQKFSRRSVVGLRNYRIIVKDAIAEKKIIPYKLGDAVAYIYYVYTRKK